MRAGLMFATQPHRAAEVLPYADLVKRGLAGRLWMGTSFLADTQLSLAYLAGAGYRIPVGTGVALTALRSPLQAAVEARSLAALTGHRFVAGFGAATPEFVAHVLGRPYPRPAAAVRDYLSRVGAYLRGHAELPPYEHPPVELGAGVLRPGMARAAGASADVAITWMTPPSYLRDTIIPALREGAAGRRATPRVATVVHAAVERAGRDAPGLAYAAACAHLCSPHYTGMLRLAGCEVNPYDPVSGARRLVEQGVFLYGPARHIGAALREYERAGVDEIILNLAGVHVTEGCRAAVEDAAEILESLSTDQE
jgi:Coenzyme F420-dependent N5,N10-methylene tetrahydromethanopterin reductase and related flavin-dependent oxidoreductases